MNIKAKSEYKNWRIEKSFEELSSQMSEQLCTKFCNIVTFHLGSFIQIYIFTVERNFRYQCGANPYNL